MITASARHFDPAILFLFCMLLAVCNPTALSQEVTDVGGSPARSNEVSDYHEGLPQYVQARSTFKITVEDCELRGGEFAAAQSALRAEDWVTCILPSTVRRLGSKVHVSSRQILASAYDYLYRSEIESPGYGLYTYVLFPTHSKRSERFLAELFSTTSFIELSHLRFDHLNIIYLPTRADLLPELLPLISDGSPPPISMFSEQLYDHSLAESLLAQICISPTDAIASICRSDLSRGPYIFTFPRPASALSPAPAPYLFVDLSDVHDKAFGEYLTAYKEQVKRPDYEDRERIDRFRLRLLSIILTSADWIGPIRGALADTIYFAEQRAADAR